MPRPTRRDPKSAEALPLASSGARSTAEVPARTSGAAIYDGPNLSEADFRRSCMDKIVMIHRDAFTMKPHNWLHYKIADSHADELLDLLGQIYRLLKTVPILDLRSVEQARSDVQLQRFLSEVRHG